MVESTLEDQHLHALAAMGSTCFAHPEDLFDHGLNLLVRHLKVDWAVVASRTGRGLENLWCAGGPAQHGSGTPLPHDPNQNFCAQVLRQPGSTLVIPDAILDPLWSEHPAWRQMGIRAYVGAPLRFSGQAMGVLSVQCEAARRWHRSEIALVNAVAALFGKAMEVEDLKAKLWQTQEALDLTSAVVEDSALESPATRLPTRRFLEVWSKTSLMLARRRREVIALVTWRQPPEPGREKLLGAAVNALRGVDLLVDLGRDQFLLVLPRTLRGGAEIVLERLRRTLGPLPMGATLWNPVLNPDRDAPSLQPAIRRAQAGLPGGLDRGVRGGEDGKVVWTFLTPSRENILDGKGEW